MCPLHCLQRIAGRNIDYCSEQKKSMQCIQTLEISNEFNSIEFCNNSIETKLQNFTKQ